MWWFVLPLFSFLTGLTHLRWWSVFAWPAVSMAVGAILVQAETTNYDMHGFGYVVGLYTGLACVVTWLLGRGLSRLRNRRNP
jgi:hypothetical protein